MDRRQIAAKLVLDALHIPVRLRTFNERLIIQKAVYLAQAADLDLGYHFRWYLRGPYSPGLTRDVFAMEDELEQTEDDAKGWVLDQESQAKLSGLANLISPGGTPTDARSLELLASVHFLVNCRQVPGRTPEAIRTVLKEYRKEFSEPEIRQALSSLQQHGLLPA